MANQEKTVVFRSLSARDRFTLVANTALRDPRISYRAKGILATCLSLPQDFEFTRKWIEEHGTEGRDSIIAALKELRSYGYLENIKQKDSRGRIFGEFYRFSDEPAPAQAPEQAPSDPSDRRPEKPASGFPVRRCPDGTSKNSVTVPLCPESTAATGDLPDSEEIVSEGVDRVSRLPAYRVGAGNISNGRTESDISCLPSNPGLQGSSSSQPERQGSLQLERQPGLSVLKTPTVGEGVGKESEETPREPLVISDSLCIPAWLQPYKPYLLKWLENRRKKHKLDPELTKFTLNGLTYAKDLGVLAEYCEYSAEMNWRSLGFAGHKELIQKLAKEHGKALKPEKPVMADIVYTLGVNK
jgi:hypothetical protein